MQTRLSDKPLDDKPLSNKPVSQEQLKHQVALVAVEEIRPYLLADAIIGVGTGSTADLFIDALAAEKHRFAGAVASSERSARRLEAHGIQVLDLNAVERLPVYVDGADEVNDALEMIKGGGAALTREKIVAAVAERFVCIADGSKLVATLGRFPLPVEVIPMAHAHVTRRLLALAARLGKSAEVRLRQAEHGPLVTDNGNYILDVFGLVIDQPIRVEAEINMIVGVVTNGLFAARAANVLLLATQDGVRKMLPPADEILV